MTIPVLAHAVPVSVSARKGVSAVGLYRLTLSAKDRKAKTVHMIVRDGASGISGMLLDKESESWLTNLRMEGSVLKGNIMTNEGLAELALNVDDSMVMGTLTVGGKVLTIDGDRTN
jgi:hypothetical protein